VTAPVERQVRTLRVLVLKRNRITQLPDELGLMTRLTKLDVSDNAMVRLPSSFSSLVNLVEVRMHHSSRSRPGLTRSLLSSRRRRFLAQPECVHQAPVLRRNLLFGSQLYASSNHFTKLPAMPFPRLRFMDASWNTLEQLPDAFYRCTSLETLELG
jgi:Leucine-rich repeat (LRR) protein